MQPDDEDREASGRPGKSGGDVPVRWSWRWERGTWEVPVGGLREMNFFWEGIRG